MSRRSPGPRRQPRIALLLTLLFAMAAALTVGCASSTPVGAVAERPDTPAGEQPATTPITAARQLEPFYDDASEQMGYRDADTGEVVLEPVYVMTSDFTEGGIASVIDANHEVWIINRNGEKLFKGFWFDNGPDYFEEGLARFERDGRIGFFDESGRIVVEPQFDFAWPFQNGRAGVCVGCVRVPDGEHFTVEGGQHGVIDRNGNFIEPLK